MEVVKLAISLCFLFPAITASRQGDLFDEPRCSKFHFEEKLLEKVVRFEVKLETMQTKFDELANQLMTQQQILTQDRDQLLTDARALKADLTSDAQDLRVSLVTSQTAADGRVDELVKTTQSQVARMSGDVHTLLNKTTADIIDAANVPPVAFKAKSLKDISSISGGDALVFEQVMMNLGGGYDADTGQFTAPQSGVYLFTVQLCMTLHNLMGVRIVTGTGEILNGMRISGNSMTSGCFTSTAIASLIQGEDVMTNCQYTSHRRGSYQSPVLYQTQKDAENKFSGALIHNHN